MQYGDLAWNDGRTTKASCPVCGSVGDHTHVVSVANPLNDGRNLDFFKCSACASLFPEDFSHPVYSNSTVSQNYSKYYAEVGAGIAAFVDILSAFRGDRDIKTYLDVGCGFGFSLDFVSRCLRWKGVGVEPGAYGRIGAEALKLDIDANILGSGSRFDGETFDFVFSSEVIEHVDSPLEFLRLLFRSTKIGGKIAITTPAAECILEERWSEQTVAHLSPGYHAFILSESALSALLKQAGFDDVQVINREDHLVAVASRGRRLPRLDLRKRHIREQLQYLEKLVDEVDNPWVRDGALYRLFKEYANMGDYKNAKKIREKLLAIFKEGYGQDFVSPGGISALSEVASDFDRYGSSAPYFISCFLYYNGLIYLNDEKDYEAAYDLFVSAERMAICDVDRTQAYFIESASLLWLIKLHVGLSLLYGAKRADAIDELSAILDSERQRAYPWSRGFLPDYIVTRAMKETAVAHLQLADYEAAERMFGAVLARREEPESRGLHKEVTRLIALVARDQRARAGATSPQPDDGRTMDPVVSSEVTQDYSAAGELLGIRPRRFYPTALTGRMRGSLLRRLRCAVRNAIEAARASILGRIRMSIGSHDYSRRRVAVYSHYAASRRISSLVEKQLRAYKALGYEILFVSMCESLDPATLDRLGSLCCRIFVRRSFGRDFGAWHDVILAEELSKYDVDELLLVNDSVVGPLAPLAPFFDVMRRANGMWGMIDSQQNGSHLQSFFLLGVGRQATTAMLEFFHAYKPTSSKEATIFRGELKVASTISKKGVPVYSLFDSYEAMLKHLENYPEMIEFALTLVPNAYQQLSKLADRDIQRLFVARLALLHQFNPTHQIADTLVKNFGFPYLKTELILQNPTRVQFSASWPSAIPGDSPCSYEDIADHLSCL